MKKIIAALFVIVLMISFTACAGSSAEFVWAPPDGALQISAADPAGSVLMDNEGCTITVVKCMPSANNTSGINGFAYQLSFENKSDTDLTLKIDNSLAINGFYIEYYNGGEAVIEAGVEETAYIFVPFAYFENIASTFEDINVVEFTLSVYETDVGDILIYKEGEEEPEFYNPIVTAVIYPKADTAQTVTIPARPSSENEVELANNDDFAFIVTGFDNTGEGVYGYLYGYVVYVYIENKTDHILFFDIENTMLDGNAADLYWGSLTYLPANQRAVIALQWPLDSNGAVITEASEIQFDLTVKNYNTGDSIDGFDQKTLTFKTW